MITTLKKAIELYIGLQSIRNKKLPIKLSYSVAYNTDLLEKEVKRVDAEKMKLIKQYAMQDENGDPVTFEDNGQTMFDLGENRESFIRDYEDFLSLDVELDIRTISDDVFDKCDDSKYDAFNMEEMSAILFMID